MAHRRTETPVQYALMHYNTIKLHYTVELDLSGLRQILVEGLLY